MERLSAAQLVELRNAAAPYVRHGTVSAHLVLEATTWHGANGEELHADIGDWMVTDGTAQWSVAPDVFITTYRQVLSPSDSTGESNVFERVGTIYAVRVDVDAVVPTLEGDAVLRAGDWLCFGSERGECWPVHHDRFIANQRPAPTDDH